MVATKIESVPTSEAEPEITCAHQPPLRVLFVSHTYVVGVNQGKLAAIAQTGQATLGLLVPGRWQAQSWKKQFDLEQPYSEIRYYPAKVFFNGKTGAYLYSFWSTLQAIQQFRPDILHVEEEVFSLSTFQMAIIARLLGKPLVVFGWENLDRRFSPLRYWLMQFVLNTAKLIIAGNQDGQQLLRQWGYTGPIDVMPQMGVDRNLFAIASVREPETEFRIGYMGRLVYEKGVDLLFAAARQLHERGLRFRLILCGSGQDEAILRQEAEKWNISDLITWKGKVPHADVPQEMSRFDVLVLPSRTISTWKEQFGHVLIEAMSMGVPVVGSTCGEIPNVIGRSDLVFPEENSEALAVILERMIEDPDWHQEIRQYGIDRVEEHYTHERIAERLVAQWSELLNPTI